MPLISSFDRRGSNAASASGGGGPVTPTSPSTIHHRPSFDSRFSARSKFERPAPSATSAGPSSYKYRSSTLERPNGSTDYSTATGTRLSSAAAAAATGNGSLSTPFGSMGNSVDNGMFGR